MNEHDTIQAISINLLRIAEWYYKDPTGNVPACERYLSQSKQLSTRVTAPKAQPYLQQLESLSLTAPSEPPSRTAERFLTLGVLLQHPHTWL